MSERWRCGEALVRVAQASSISALVYHPGAHTVRFEKLSFGLIRVDGVTYHQDIVIDRGEIRLRKKKPSKRFRGGHGHTPLSIEEKIPWKCRRLVIGTGAEGALPIMPEVRREADRRGVELVALRTLPAVKLLEKSGADVNAVLHITC